MEIKFIRLMAQAKLDRFTMWCDADLVWINLDKIDSVTHHPDETETRNMVKEHYLITTDHGQFAVSPEEYKKIERQLERVGLWEETQ